MSNRVIRDGILTSVAVNQLDWPEEVFFRRLLSYVDDFGRCEVHPSLFRGFLYSCKIDSVTEKMIEGWLAACVRAGLVKLYTVNGKNYLEVLKFDQKLRRMIARCPAPPDLVSKTGIKFGEPNRNPRSDR